MNARKVIALVALIIFISTISYVGYKAIGQLINGQSELLNKLKDIEKKVTIKQTITKEVNMHETQCLIENAYHEARNQTEEGIAATVHVVLNRVASGKFPNTPCGVVKERTSQTQCQFSWYCDGLKDDMRNKEMLAYVTGVVHRAIESWYLGDDVTKGATFYHATYVKPNWNNLEKITQIGDHIFYRFKQTCQNNPKDCTLRRVSRNSLKSA